LYTWKRWKAVLQGKHRNKLKENRVELIIGRTKEVRLIAVSDIVNETIVVIKAADQDDGAS